MPKQGDLRVWWIPQVPMKPFTVDVKSVEEGVKIMDVLAFYDIFQFENNIKGDYANAGGLSMWAYAAPGGKFGWVDWCDEATCCDDPREYLLTVAPMQ